MSSRYYALLSGVCASAASLFGKLTGLPALQEFMLIRLLLFGLMILFNGGVWTLYVKALQSSSSLSATILSASANYLLSAVTGFLIFQESTSLFWWSGAGLILLGIILIATDINDDDKNKQK